MTPLENTAPPSQSIAHQLFEARQRLDCLHREITQVSATLTDPNDDQLVALDTQIGATGSLIRRLERMQAGEQARLSEAERAQRKEKLQAAYDKAISLAESRIDLAAKIDKHLAALGGLLAAWAAVGAECRSSAAKVHRDSSHSFASVMLDSASGFSSQFVGAMEWGLFRAGVGRTGVPLDILMHFHHPLGEPYGMQDAAHGAVRIVRTRLSEDLAKSLQEIEQ
jgi:hypothetical protein